MTERATRRVWPAGILAARSSIDLALFGLLPLLLLLYVERKIFVGSDGFEDLRVLLHAGDEVLHGRSPYPQPRAVVAHAYDYYVYPAPFALVMAPFAALPFSVAATLFSLLMIASILLSLRILGVEDWRCYGAAFLWFPTLLAVLVGNITPLLVLGLALLWRFRDRRLVAAFAAAGLIIAKLFLWPLLIWLLATRRVLTLLIAAAATIAISLAGWAVLGFDGLRAYPHLLAKLSRVEEDETFSPTALAHALGSSRSLAQLAAILVGAALTVAAVIFARGREGDRISFVLSLTAGLLLSPIVWLHFFAVLLVPVALAERRLTPIWLLPLVLWVLKTNQSHTSFGSVWRIALPLVITSVLVVASILKMRGEPLRVQPSRARKDTAG